MNYKIAIIGSQGVGKSCLARELSKRLNILLITEIARRYDRNELLNVSSERYMIIQKELLKLQIDEESKYEQFISDRSTIDNLAYYIHNCAPNDEIDEAAIYADNALHNAEHYSHIFLLIPEFYPKADGFRSTDIVYQMRIDAIIQTILHLYGIKYCKLTGSVENRVKKAMEILRKGKYES